MDKHHYIYLLITMWFVEKSDGSHLFKSNFTTLLCLESVLYDNEMKEFPLTFTFSSSFIHVDFLSCDFSQLLLISFLFCFVFFFKDCVLF